MTRTVGASVNKSKATTRTVFLPFLRLRLSRTKYYKNLEQAASPELLQRGRAAEQGGVMTRARDYPQDLG